MAFAREGQVGCFREERIIGDKNVAMVRVHWSDKELFNARLLFLVSGCY